VYTGLYRYSYDRWSSPDGRRCKIAMPAQEDPPNRRSVSPIPAYRRIEEDIRTKVRDAHLPAGTMLAGRHNLAREYGVSLSTVQQAIANLIADGTLETYDRRGTFVAARGQDDEPEAPGAGELISEGLERVPVDAPQLPPSLERSEGKAGAILGILSTAWIDSQATRDTGSLWAQLAIRSMERVVAAAGGATRYFNRFPDHLGPFEHSSDDVRGIPIREAAAALCAEGADALAIIALTEHGDSSDEILAAVDIERVPTVYLSWHEIRPPLAQVYYDNRFAGYQAAQHLLRNGYRRLLFIAPCAETWLQERIASARDAVRHAQLPPETLLVHPAEPVREAYDRQRTPETAYAIARQVFATLDIFAGREAEQCCGIIAPNDISAYAILAAADEAGKRVGRDFGLIGFDDDPRSCSIGLTTVRPPIEAMGEEAGRLLLHTIKREHSGLRVCLRSHVIPRASTVLRP
jgi:DNA-binding LacI/PurR family transcriptional regulator/DNA-binding transcriptional regulator YhcF (GntR family)